jgi:hypothetical protein
MVEERYSNQQVMDISRAGKTAVSRWKKQYIAEQKGEVIKGKTALMVTNVVSNLSKNNSLKRIWISHC